MTFPSHLIADVKIKSITSSYKNRTRSFRRSARRTGWHVWEFTLMTNYLDHAQQRDLDGFLDSLEGQVGTFEQVFPVQSNPINGNSYPNVRSSASYAAGLKVVELKGLPVSEAALQRGDMLKFQNSRKVYRITNEPGITSGSGTLSVTLNTPLVKAVLFEEPIVVNDIPFTLARSEDELITDLTSKRGGLVQKTLKFEEQWHD